MLTAKAVWAMVPMVTPCACRHNGFAADLADKRFVAWVCLIVILLE
jgi:hypothetical protein